MNLSVARAHQATRGESATLEPFEHARVLVIDDTDSSVALLRAVLTRAGLRTVHAVSDPEHALDRFHELRPELVLLDLHMPRVDGYTILAQLCEQGPPELPVLVLTADTTREATYRALRLGARDFLTKPLDTVEVTLRVRNLLETNALHVNLRRRQQWLEASGQVARALIAGDGAEPSRLIADCAREIGGADLVAIAMQSAEETPQTVVTSASISLDGEVGGAAIAMGRSLCAPVIASGKPVLLADVAEAERKLARLARLVDIGPAMVVPLTGSHGVRGALCLCRAVGSQPFTPAELDMATGFGHQVAIALELADARADQQRLRTNIEHQLREQNAELEKVGRAKDSFLTNMSHELRTPLNAIIGFTGTLLMELPGPLNDVQSRQLRTVERNGKHLLAIITDILDLAKIESGAVDLALGPVDCIEVIQRAMSLLRPLAVDKGLELTVELPDRQVIVQSDTRALGQILINLVGNAVKFTDTGNVHVSLTPEGEGGATKIAVSDTGPGIAEEDLHRIFNAFDRGGRRTAPSKDGTGLGLYISHKLAELIGAGVSVDTAYGSGSIFTVTLQTAA